jgi:hypothetical protein
MAAAMLKEMPPGFPVAPTRDGAIVPPDCINVCPCGKSAASVELDVRDDGEGVCASDWRSFRPRRLAAQVVPKQREVTGVVVAVADLE